MQVGAGGQYSRPGTRDGPLMIDAEDSASFGKENQTGPLLYLSHGQKNMKEMDMYDAIDRLRRMKSV